MQRIASLAAATLLGLAALPLSAAEGQPYVGLLGGYASPDSARKVDDGFGARALIGVMAGERFSWELSLAGYQADHEYDGDSLTASTLGIDARYLFGAGRIAPFVIGGLGYGYNDEPEDTQTVPSANLGLGLLGQIGERLALRAEARYVGMFREDLAPGEDQLFDARADIGLEYRFAGPAPVAPPPPAVVEVQDSDGDGVLDPADQCPDTPPGTPVDANGCPLPPADGDGDGVLDGADKCPDTPAGMKVDQDGCVKKEQTLVLTNITFESDSAQIRDDGKQILDGIYEGLQGQPGMKLHIVGHTDFTHTEAYNLELSKARAASVVQYLIQRGIDGGRLTSDGKGESEPVASNHTEEGKAQNRRVEFKVIEQ